MTQARLIGQIHAVRDEQQRVGVIGRVQLRRRKKGAIKGSGPCHRLEVADENANRAVRAALHDELATGEVAFATTLL